MKKSEFLSSKHIKEVGDKTAGSYKYNKSTDSEYKTEYTFTTDSGLNYIVEFAFEEDEAAFVDFYVKSNAKGNKYTQVVNKGELFKVMATVTTIIEEFLSTREDIKTLYIEPSESPKDNKRGSKSPKDDKRRFNLYKKYIEKNLDTKNYSVDLESGWGGIITIERKSIQDLANEQIPGLIEKGTESALSRLPSYLKARYKWSGPKDKNEFFDFIENIKGEIKRVPLSSIKPSQFGKDYKNTSSEQQAKEFQKILNGEKQVQDHRKEDFYPIVVNKKDNTIIDGNHRHYALSAINSPYAVVLYVDIPKQYLKENTTTMKKSELRQIVKEEYHKILNERLHEPMMVLDFIRDELKLGSKQNIFDAFLKKRNRTDIDLSEFMEQVIDKIKERYL